ncbi:unnamed protein product (mitochondrion) [Plasmodiophora brassicae]|uniref:Uncharacterized protein n=1 Tax=Plasmodiophora brassicae TaxID=37360 RepID=A0A3P3YDU3_PLABS|nr:unnamed protein product [Plasmodiophora brassicae]
MGNMHAAPAFGIPDSTPRRKASRFRNAMARVGACLSPPDLLDGATFASEMDALRQRIGQLESTVDSLTRASMPSPPPTAPGAPSPPAPPLTVPGDGKLDEGDATAGKAPVDLSVTTTAVAEPDDVAPADSSRIGGHSIQVVDQQPASMLPQQPACPKQNGSASAGDDPANVLLDDSSDLLDGADGETQEPADIFAISSSPAIGVFLALIGAVAPIWTDANWSGTNSYFIYLQHPESRSRHIAQ